MQKKILLLLVFGFSILAIAVLNWEIVFQPDGLPQFKVVVSCDGSIEPGIKQEFIVYPLESTNFSPWEKAKFTAKLEIIDSRGSFTSVSESKALKERHFPLRFSLKVPQDIAISSVYFNLYTSNFQQKLFYSKKLEVKNDIAIAVFPPGKQLFCGDWVSLKILAFNKKTMKGHYKVPSRVKMTTPHGATTINRIINSELDGTSVFTTFINSNSPQGIYKFEITHGNQLIKITLPVKSADRKTASISKTVAITGLPILSGNTLDSESKKELFCIKFPKKRQIISQLKHGNNQFSFYFDCSNSLFRSVEIWQNGILFNQSNLPVDVGRSSQALPLGINLSSPIRVKLWMLKDGHFETDEQVVLFEKGSKKSQNSFYSLLESNIKFPREPIIQRLMSFPTPLFSNIDMSDKGFAPKKQEIRIEPLEENLIRFNQALSNNESMRFLEFANNRDSVSSQFILVDTELELEKYNFDQLKIHLSPSIFFRRFIAALYQPDSGIEIILSEAEARAMRFKYLSFTEQSSELEKLEGLLIPISEFIQFSAAHEKELESLRIRAFNVLAQMGNLIHLPAPLAQQLAPFSQKIRTIGPASAILESNLSEETVNFALKKGGKVRIKTTTNDFPVNLSSSVIDFNNRNFAGGHRILEKLSNLRTGPVLVELIYSDSGNLK